MNNSRMGKKGITDIVMRTSVSVASGPQGVPHSYGMGSMPPEHLELPIAKKRKQSQSWCYTRFYHANFQGADKKISRCTDDRCSLGWGFQA